MTYSEPTSLAIVACPGGEKFAEEVIAHLDHIYVRRFKQKVSVLAKRYNLPEEEIIRKTNFSNDASTSDICIRGSVDHFRSPKFKIDSTFTYFMNGEFKAQVNQCIRGKDAYIFQDVENHQEISLNNGKNKFSLSVNDHLMCLLVAIDAVRQAGADRITLVLPVYPYSRQHKKKGREGLTASFLGHLYENLGVSRIITLDIHSREIENAFNTAQLDNLHASYQIIRELSKIVDLTGDDLVVVSPDTGAVDRNKFYSAGLQKPLAMIDRKSTRLNSSHL